MVADVPEARQRDAEEVRRHLVALRGGGPFLSPDDALLLDEWLSDGIAVPRIVHALERAAAARRKRPTRVPLSLSAARRHLGKRSRGGLPAAAVATSPDGHPLQPLIDAVRATREPAHADELADLADALAALPAAEPVTLEREAQALIRDFFVRIWTSMADWERREHLTRAREELGDLAELLSPEALETSCEAIARDALRRAYPALNAATVDQVLNR